MLPTVLCLLCMLFSFIGPWFCDVKFKSLGSKTVYSLLLRMSLLSWLSNVLPLYIPLPVKITLTVCVGDMICFFCATNICVRWGFWVRLYHFGFSSAFSERAWVSNECREWPCVCCLLLCLWMYAFTWLHSALLDFLCVVRVPWYLILKQRFVCGRFSKDQMSTTSNVHRPPWRWRFCIRSGGSWLNHVGM